MAKWVKNTSGATGTWVGQQINDTEYYQIQSSEETKWANDSLILTDIGSGDLTISKDDSGNTDLTNVAAAINYLKDDTEPRDADGVRLARNKITRTGWHFQVHAIEAYTSKLNSIYNKDEAGNDLGLTTIKYYNASDVELTAGTQIELDTNCVKTVINWEPTEDIEMIGGVFKQTTIPSSDIRLWITAIPDLTVAQGGSVPFVQGGINLRHVDSVTVDGKTPKLLPYNTTYHTSKFRITLKHDLGVQAPITMLFELYRLNT